MSTIPLLPPERSHICIAFASLLWAQSFAGSGVGAAATSLGVLDPTAAADADADGVTADDPGEDVDGDAPGLHAVMSMTAAIARTGNLSGLLILGSSISRRPGVSLHDCCHGVRGRRRIPRTDHSNRVPTIVCNHRRCQAGSQSRRASATVCSVCYAGIPSAGQRDRIAI